MTRFLNFFQQTKRYLWVNLVCLQIVNNSAIVNFLMKSSTCLWKWTVGGKSRRSKTMKSLCRTSNHLLPKTFFSRSGSSLSSLIDLLAKNVEAIFAFSFFHIPFPIHQEILLALLSECIQMWSLRIAWPLSSQRGRHSFSGLLEQTTHPSVPSFPHWSPVWQPGRVKWLQWGQSSAVNPERTPITLSERQSPDTAMWRYTTYLPTHTLPPHPEESLWHRSWWVTPRLTHSPPVTPALLWLKHPTRALCSTSGSWLWLVPLPFSSWYSAVSTLLIPFMSAQRSPLSGSGPLFLNSKFPVSCSIFSHQTFVIF